jgi:ammonia channel protein AmtB
LAIVNTNVAAASSMIMWISPDAGYVQPGYALLMGLIDGFLVYIFFTSMILSMYSVVMILADSLELF